MQVNKRKARIAKITATLTATVPPFVATCTQFPMWVEHSSKATMSGLFLVLAVISCLPFLKQIKEYAKSPASWAVWGVILVSLILIRNIINQMIIVAGVGLISNLISTGIFKISDHYANLLPNNIQANTT